MREKKTAFREAFFLLFLEPQKRSSAVAQRDIFARLWINAQKQGSASPVETFDVLKW